MEYDALTVRNSARNATRLLDQRRNQGFNLFSFLERLWQVGSGIKQIESMKPSSANLQRTAPYTLTRGGYENQRVVHGTDW